MYNRVHRGLLVSVCLLALVLAGCIQPIDEVDQTKTAQATMGFAPVSLPTQTPATQPATSPAETGMDVATVTPVPEVPQQVEQFVRLRGDMPNDLALWGDQLRGPDRLVGFSYTGAAGVPCVGYLLLTSADGGWRATDSGALTCAQATPVETLAANTFILTTDGQPNTLVFGRLQDPAVTQVQVTFDDGSSESGPVASGGFLVIKPGVASPTAIAGLDAQGNPVLPDIPYSPV